MNNYEQKRRHSNLFSLDGGNFTRLNIVTTYVVCSPEWRIENTNQLAFINGQFSSINLTVKGVVTNYIFVIYMSLHRLCKNVSLCYAHVLSEHRLAWHSLQRKRKDVWKSLTSHSWNAFIATERSFNSQQQRECQQFSVILFMNSVRAHAYTFYLCTVTMNFMYFRVNKLAHTNAHRQRILHGCQLL